MLPVKETGSKLKIIGLDDSKEETLSVVPATELN